ncbi:MAG: VWA domain-containing protein [Deltaproteobacteria bacterium]|nr:VWA domain-containing protein [Deltaproteobacteria bacterium]
MTLLGLPFAQLALIFGGLAMVVTLLYILKLRRRRVAVPFANLWQRVIKERQSDSLFHRLKRLASLLLQLLLLLLLVAALGNPRLTATVMKERRVLLLLDTSASMRATDGDHGTRMETALARSREIVRGLGGGDSMMLVRMDAHITPLTPFTGDEKALLQALKKVEPTDTRADLARALKFAADALAGHEKPMLILVGDGAYDAQVLQSVQVGAKGAGPSAAKKGQPPSSRPAPAKKGQPLSSRPAAAKRIDYIDLRGIEATFIPVGKEGDNVGIVAFSARRYPTNKLSFELFLEIANYRKTAVEVDLQLYADGNLTDVKRVTLAAGKRERFTCSPTDHKGSRRTWCDMAAMGELLEARLVRPGSTEKGAQPNASSQLDAFPLDDRAYALLPKRKKMKVLLVTKGNLFLEGALLLEENLELTRITPERYTQALAQKADALVFHAFSAAAPAHIPLLLIDPPKDTPLIKTAGVVERPIITEQSTAHPIMRFVTLKDVNISHATRFATGKHITPLAATFRAPILVAQDDGKRRLVAMGFDPQRSDLPLRVAFPLLIINTFHWFAGGDESLVTSYHTGATWEVPLPLSHDTAPPPSVEIMDPRRQSANAPVSGQHVVLYGRYVGLYEVLLPGARFQVAANLADPLESQIEAKRALTLGGQKLSPPTGFSTRLRREIWLYLLLIVIGLLLLEWLTYNRRMTV